MATIGHTLTGLSLAGIGPGKTRRAGLVYVWPGLLVLLAHLVDLVEWTALLVAPAHGDKRFLTHSPMLAGGLVIAVWLIMGLVTGLRRPLPYVVAGVAVMSHLVLDHPLVRAVIADACGYPMDEMLPGLWPSVLAEVWLFGLLFVGMAIITAVRQPVCPSKARAAGVTLGMLSALAAATRWPALWGPAYAISLLHAAILLRRWVTARWLWSAVPILPLGVFLAVEFAAGRETERAAELFRQGDYGGAIARYRHVLSFPTRSTSGRTYVELSWCYEKIGELEAAEAALIRGCRVSPGDATPIYWLARFYVNPRWRDTRFFRPGEARDLFMQIRDGPYSERQRAYAVSQLTALRERGLID